MDPDNIVGTWDAQAAAEILTAGKAATVATAAGYTDDLLAEMHERAPRLGRIDPAAFTQRTVDGRTVLGLTDFAVPRTLEQIGGGVSVADAVVSTGSWLITAALTELADTKRAVIAAETGLTPMLTGYTRVLTPPSCSRCMILAGKRFKWNTGFQRHPGCDCVHLPSSIVAADGHLVDPYAAFEALSTAEQDALYGKAGAEAIRNGADIYRVENSRLSHMSTTQRPVRRGERYTVDELLAETRGMPEVEARRHFRDRLAAEGYITGPQVAGGNIRGNRLTPLRGDSAAAVAERVALAGGRDPLNRYTMTASERRLHDATYRLRYYERHGVIPNSIGDNSADRGTTFRRPSAREVDELRDLVDVLGNRALSGNSASLARLQLLLDDLDVDEMERRIRAAQTASDRARAALGRR